MISVISTDSLVRRCHSRTFARLHRALTVSQCHADAVASVPPADKSSKQRGGVVAHGQTYKAAIRSQGNITLFR